MSAQRHRRIAELFEVACDLDPAQREAWLERECDDESMRAEVRTLLAHDARPHSAIQATASGRAGLVQQALQAAAAPLSERGPTSIGPYKLLWPLGEGGMGQVFAAEQSEPVSRRVALKVIKAGLDSAQIVARFEFERRTLARMSHPNVAQVFDGGATDDGRPFLVMELVEGTPITDYCDSHGLSTRSRLALFLDVCEGVEHAHQKGIIHRDLKPSNLLVTELGGRPIPKVIDFGVARAISGTLAERTMQTMAGQLVGTLDYMSPEQADPALGDVDTRSDVYSLGVVLYELVSGFLPFQRSGAPELPVSEVLREIREVDPPAPSTRVRRCSGAVTEIAARRATDEGSLIRQLHGDLDWITLKALEKSPSRRYASAAALADDVRRHLANEPVLAARQGTGYRLSKWVRRHRAGAIAAVVVVAALGTGLFGIVSGRIAAEARSAELLRLSDGHRMEQIIADSERLWPPHPDRIDALVELQERTKRLIENLPDHRATLERRAWNPASAEDAWQKTMLDELVLDLDLLKAELLDATEPVPSFGWSLGSRLETARAMRARFADGSDVAAAWTAALPAIRAAYPGLELSAQMGLLPLGPDLDSHLWEFAHLLSGAPAQRNPETGKIAIAEESGIVLVLLPAGTFWMGAQREDPTGRNYDPNLGGHAFDAMAEGPGHEATVKPFFVSKFEMTQAQWDRFVLAAASDRKPRKSSGTLPVRNVSLSECERTTRWLGLTLPSEEEWEYATRAGTDTPWCSGASSASLEGVANLLDGSVVENAPAFARHQETDPVPWNDGSQFLCSVGSYAASAFGLHDVHGNVSEWCFTHRRDYRSPRSEVRLDEGVSRGGTANHGYHEARSSGRSYRQGGSAKYVAAGLRPVRAIDH